MQRQVLDFVFYLLEEVAFDVLDGFVQLDDAEGLEVVANVLEKVLGQAFQLKVLEDNLSEGSIGEGLTFDGFNG